MKPVWVVLICVGVAAAIALIALFVVFSNDCLTVTRYDLPVKGVPAGGLKIVHLSDLHAKRFGKNGKKLFDKVAAESPDFIAFTGDIIHKYRQKDINVAVQTVEELCKIAPVYYVSGNHEMRSKAYRSLKEKLASAGAVVLDDRAERAFGITVIGLNCANLRNGKVFSAADGVEGFKLLLAHKPQFIDRYAMAGYDVALCGHAHGGQWRIPFTGIGVYSPGQGLFPKYTSGVHKCADLRMVISRGLGNSECPLRLFNRPEVVVVNLVPDGESGSKPD